MKLTAILLFLACLQVSARGYAQKITLDEKDAPLEKIFREIRQQAGYAFWYEDKLLQNAKTVDIHVANASLEEVLDLCLAGQPLTYEIIDNTIVLKAAPAETIPLPADAAVPPIDIHGRITDSLGNPLAGVNILVRGSSGGTATDADGQFILAKVNPDATLEISSEGYERQEIRLNGRSEILLRLKVSAKLLDKIDVIYSNGYQNIPKERATGLFAAVDNQLYNREVSTDVLSRLEGIVPGMAFFHNTTSTISGGTNINIDGHTTLFSNDQPLIVVDNFAYDGNITDINPNDVDNITVLKDAAAASIWGVRSGNGVIVITTKKGKRNQKLAVECNANITVTPKPDLYYGNGFLDANDYINIEQKLFGLGYYNSQLSRSFNVVSPVVQILADEQAGTISPADATGQIDAFRNNDVRRDMIKYFYQRSVNQQYAVDLKGGGPSSDYYFSLGEDHDLSNQVGNANNRITIKSTYNFYPAKNLQLSAGMDYIQGDATNNSENYSYLNNPYTKLADANGNPLAINAFFSPAYEASVIGQGFLDWQLKPLAETKLADNTTKTTDNLINLGVKYGFLKDFSAAINYRYERSVATQLIDNSISTYNARNLINEFTQVSPTGSLTYPIPLGGILDQSAYSLFSQQARAQLNFSHTWDRDNQLTAIAGTEIRSAVNQYYSYVAYGYNKNTEASAPYLNYASSFQLNPLGYGSSTIPNGSGFSKTTDNFISYFSNAAYTYKSLYTLSLSGRIDHSNLFGVSTNQKAVPLYSGGISWELSKERFYHLKFLPLLKPRITYGYTANINTSVAAVTTIKEPSYGSSYNNLNYANINNPGNPDLQWEKDQRINVGVTYALKNNILSGNIDYYWKKGINLFGSSALAPSSGLQSFYGNTSSTKGQGTDIVLNSKNIDHSAFKWTSNFLLSYVQDKVTKYNVTTTVNSLFSYGSGSYGTVVPVVGAPVFGVYSYKWGGLTNTTGDPQGYLNGKLSTNWSSIISSTLIKDLVYNGPGRPTTFGSLRNNFSYKQFSFSFNIRYEFNYCFRKSSVSDVSFVQVSGSGLGNSDYLKAWKKPGDELFTNIPAMQYPPFNYNRESFYEYSAALIDKGDNIRLQDISFGYELAKPHVKRLPVSYLQIYGYLSNLGILWRANKDHLDPEIFSSGIPAPKTIALGVKADF